MTKVENYDTYFKTIGVQDRESKEIILEFIESLARLGIECINYKKKEKLNYACL